jgi:hypothetical protein
MMVNLSKPLNNALSVIRLYYVGIASVFLPAVLKLIKVNGSDFLTNLSVRHPVKNCQRHAVQ